MATWYKLKMPQGHTDFAAPILTSKVGATVGAGGASTAHSLAFCTKYDFDHLRVNQRQCRDKNDLTTATLRN
jgi:hypothetical protein